MSPAELRYPGAVQVARFARHAPLFPCDANKRPRTEHGFKDAAADEETISRWWGDWPDSLIGVPTGAASRLVVLDVDPDSLTDVSRRWLERHVDLLLATRSHTTRRAGRHYVWRAPDGITTRSCASVVVDGTRLEGIDIRGDGGYVIWWPAHGLAVTGEIQPLPEVLLPLFTAPRGNGSSSATVAAAGDMIRAGRNDYLSREAYRLRKQGLSVEHIENVLQPLNEARCSPPLDAREISRIARGKETVVADPKRLQTAAVLPALKPEPTTVFLRSAKSITMRPIDWIWRDWLAAGKLHAFGGVAGTGKTTLALAVAATLTIGGGWPDGAIAGRVGNVVIWSGEDSADDTLVPRLAAAGANRDRVHIVSAVSCGEDRRPFDPARDMDGLASAVKALGDVRLLILDPVVMAVPGDSHKNAEVRRALQPVVDFAEALGIAALGITHFTKGTSGKEPLERLTGSLAFGAAPRLVWAAGKEFDPDGNEIGRVLVRAKSNIGPDGGGIRYRFMQAAPEPGISVPVALWGATVTGSAREILAEPEKATADDPEQSGRGKARAEAAEFLREILKDGAAAVESIREQAKQAGISWRTVERAKPLAGVTSTKAGFAAGWGWTLNAEGRQPNTANAAEDRQHAENWRPSSETAEKHPEIPEREPRAASVASVGGNWRPSEPDGADFSDPEVRI